MYEIRKDGGVIALTEKPNYIRRHADGFYILCEEEDAQGVAVDGTVYRLMGHTGLDELEEVQLIEKDTGTVLQSSSEAVGIAFVTMTERGDDGMTETVIVAVLSLIGTMAGAYFANKKSAALIAYRLEELEQKVAKHNGLVERTYHLEEAAAVFEEKLKVANHRIDDLERGA